MSAVVLLSSIALLGGFIYVVPVLSKYNISGNVFYVILILLGLGSATLVFGAMKSYAQYRGTGFSQGLELGGPIVGAALVVVGGLYAIPHLEGSDTFNITVRALGPDNNSIGSGSIILFLDGDTRKAPIAPNGEANFKEIPSRFKNQQVTIQAEIEHFKIPANQVVLTNPLNLHFVAADESPKSEPRKPGDPSKPERPPTSSGNTNRRLDPEVRRLLSEAESDYARARYCSALEKCNAALKLAPEQPSARSLKRNIQETLSKLKIDCQNKAG